MVKKTNLKYYEAVGRRKSASARVRLYLVKKGSEVNVADLKIKAGEIFVNKKRIEDYFPGNVAKEKYLLPLSLTNNLDRFAISVLVKGGGKEGQLEAVRHGLARALLLVNTDYKPILRKYGLLTRDPRVKERRKPGTGGKARREKQSPKR